MNTRDRIERLETLANQFAAAWPARGDYDLADFLAAVLPEGADEQFNGRLVVKAVGYPFEHIDAALLLLDRTIPRCKWCWMISTHYDGQVLVQVSPSGPEYQQVAGVAVKGPMSDRALVLSYAIVLAVRDVLRFQQMVAA